MTDAHNIIENKLNAMSSPYLRCLTTLLVVFNEKIIHKYVPKVPHGTQSKDSCRPLLTKLVYIQYLMNN